MKLYTILILLLFLNPLLSVNAQVVLSSARDAVNLALQNSEEYMYSKLIALENLKLAKYSFRDFLPSIGLSFSENDDVQKNAVDTREKSIYLSISQRVFDGGKTKLQYEIGNNTSYFAYQEYEQKERLFSSEVISHYYAYLKQRELVRIQESLVENARAQLYISQKESELGLTLKTDYLEYVISFLALQSERDRSHRELESLTRKLKVLLGIDRAILLSVQGKIDTSIEYKTLSEYYDKLWNLARVHSPELRKQSAALNTAKKQFDLSRRWYAPTVSLSGGIGFSGKTYPLTMPYYQIKLSLSFENSKLFPTILSSGYGINNDGLNSVQNSAQMQVLPSSTVFIEQDMSELSILQSRLQHAHTEVALQEALYDTLFSYDDCVLNIQLTKESIEVAQLRLEFRKIELESGEIKAIDYLEDLTALAQQKITLLDLYTTAILLERSLEVSTHIPFGELRHVCSE